MTILELQQLRSKLIGEARALIDRAKEEKRDLTEAEEKEYEKKFSEGLKLKTKLIGRRRINYDPTIIKRRSRT